MTKYAIRLFHDEPIWFCNGIEELFNSENEAIKAIEHEMIEIQKDIDLGYLDDFSFEEYKIVEVSQ
jgi:adenylate cyclase